jgi:hypothetical protein
MVLRTAYLVTGTSCEHGGAAGSLDTVRGAVDEAGYTLVGTGA